MKNKKFFVTTIIILLLLPLTIAAEERTCVDPDGADSYTKATTTLTMPNGRVVTKTDECLPGKTKRVREYLCKNQTEKDITQEVYNCLFGCSDGACTKFGDPKLISLTISPEEPLINSQTEATFIISNPSQFAITFSIQAEVTKPSGTQEELTVIANSSIGANTTKTAIIPNIFFDEAGNWTIKTTLISEILDTNTANNQLTTIVYVNPAKTDLALTKIETNPAETFTAQPFDIVLTIENFGEAPSNFDLNYQLTSPDDQIINGTIIEVAEIQPNNQFQYTFPQLTFSIAGLYKAKAELISHIEDQNATNNAQEFEFYLNAGEVCAEGDGQCLIAGKFSIATEKNNYTIGEIVKLTSSRYSYLPNLGTLMIPQGLKEFAALIVATFPQAKEAATPQEEVSIQQSQQSLIFRNKQGEIEQLPTNEGASYLVATTQTPNTQPETLIIETTKNGTTQIATIDGEGNLIKMQKRIDLEPQKNFGYIIKLKSESVVDKQKRLKKQSLPQGEVRKQSKKHKQDLEVEHQNFKKKVKDILQRSPKELGDIETTMNAVALQITKAEAEKIMQLEEVEEVFENGVVQASLYQSVPQIGADKIWQLINADGEKVTGEGIRIGMIDTGTDYTHPDLGGCQRTSNISDGSCKKVAGGYDFVNADNDPMDDQGHGTHVSATAAGNGILKGVAPNATIYAYKVLSADGSGTFQNVMRAMDRSTDPNMDGDTSDHLDVISMSLGGPGDPDGPIAYVADRTMDAGVVVVAAAGNEGPSAETIGCPGCARKVITVGAVNKSDVIAYFSSRGPARTSSGELVNKPDVVAPGVSICAAEWGTAWSDRRCLDDKHVAISGTSMATPHVAGLVALVLQANPGMTPQQVKMLLKDTAVDLGYDINTQGSGRVNAVSAIGMLDGLSVNPAAIYFEDTPTQKMFVAVQKLRIKNINTSSSLSLSLRSFFIAPGLDVSFNKNDLVLAPNQQEVVNVTLSVDHDLAASGAFHKSAIQLNSTIGGESWINDIPVFITINNRIESVNASGISLGLKLPTMNSWSTTTNINFKNVRQDKAESYNLSVECCVLKRWAGATNITTNALTYSFASNPLILEAGEQKNLAFNIIANNSALETGTYTGYVVLKSPLQNYKVPFTFKKYYRLNLTYEHINHGLFILLHNRNDTALFFTTSDFDSWFIKKFREPNWYTVGGSKAVLLEKPGVYDAITANGWSWYEFVWENLVADGDNSYYINNTREFYTEILPNGSTERVWITSDFLHKFEIEPLKEDGTHVNTRSVGSGYQYIKNGNFGLIGFRGFVGDPDLNPPYNDKYWVNNFSSNYVFEWNGLVHEKERKDYFHTVTLEGGITEDTLWKNNPLDFVVLNLTYETNQFEEVVRSVNYIQFITTNWGLGSDDLSKYAIMNTTPFTRTLYYLPMKQNSVFDYIDAWLMPGESTQVRSLYESPLLHLNKYSIDRTYFLSKNNPPPIDVSKGSTHFGSYPTHWNGKIASYRSGNGSAIFAWSYYGAPGWFHTFISQQFDDPIENTPSYQYFELYHDGVLEKTAKVRRASDMSVRLDSDKQGKFSLVLPKMVGYNGYYGPYNKFYNTLVKLDFDTTKSDNSPPTFKSFVIENEKGNPVSNLNLLEKNKFTVSFDPLGGTLINVLAFYKNVNNEWETLIVEQNGNDYSFTVSDQEVYLKGKDRVTIKIVAADDTNNTLETETEIPLKIPNSFIKNLGQTTLNGYLDLAVQKLVGAEWVTTATIYKDEQPRDIIVNETLELADFWQGYVPLEAGDFRVYGALKDEAGEPLKKTDGTTFEDQWYFAVENLGSLMMQVTQEPAIQYRPVTDGERIYWIEENWDPNNLSATIHFCNMSLSYQAGGCLPTDSKNVLTKNDGTPLKAGLPMILERDQSKLVYSRGTFNQEKNRKYSNIYLFDLITKEEQRVTNDAKDQYVYPLQPMSGTRIVWFEFETYRIYMCDLNKNGQSGGCLENDEKTQITSTGSVGLAAIEGDRIFWVEINSETNMRTEIYMCNLNKNGLEGGCSATDKKTRITYSNGTAWQYYPMPFNNNLMWLDNTLNANDFWTCSLSDECTASKQKLNIGPTQNQQYVGEAYLNSKDQKLVWTVIDISNIKPSSMDGVKVNLYSYDLNTKNKELIIGNKTWNGIINPSAGKNVILWAEGTANNELYDYNVWLQKKL